jgi:hypothetical protein
LVPALGDMTLAPISLAKLHPLGLACASMRRSQDRPCEYKCLAIVNLVCFLLFWLFSSNTACQQ